MRALASDTLCLPPEPGGTAFFFLRFFAITNRGDDDDDQQQRAGAKRPTITATSHTGKLDFSFPSDFACWLLCTSRSTSECCGNSLFTSSNFGIAEE